MPPTKAFENTITLKEVKIIENKSTPNASE